MSIERREGAVLAGRFRLDRLLGQGGMGVVWAVTNTVTGRHVAMKMLHEDAAKDPGTRRRFLREGRAASAVQHPNVVQILDFIELEDQTPAMVMELLDGESLGQRLRRERKLPLADVARVLVPTVGAVGTAHALGVVHRDLKPDNIFLSVGHEGETVVKVLDFGIAKISAEVEGGASNALTGTGAMLGTPYYMAPEQLFTDETLDYRCDIWALGIILYECLAGMRPTRANSFADIVKVIATQSMVPFANAAPNVPAEIASLVTRMLSFDKNKRPQSMREVSDVLQHYTDVLATSFGEPILRPVKQSLDDSGQGGLRRADVESLFADTHETSAPSSVRTEYTAADGPATISVVNAGVRRDQVGRKRDSQSETLGTLAESQVSAPVLEATGKRRGRVALVALGVVVAVTVGYVATSDRTPSAKANANASAGLGHLSAAAAELPAPVDTARAPATAEAANAESASAISPDAASHAPANAPARAPGAKAIASGAPLTSPTPPAAPRQSATAPTSHGGLVENPPF